MTWRDWLGFPDITGPQFLKAILIGIALVPLIALAVGE